MFQLKISVIDAPLELSNKENIYTYLIRINLTVD